jgi:hypothetical protein
MINHIASCGSRSADIAALRQNRAKKTDATPEGSSDATVQKGKAHQHQHVPPGLARAAENIASNALKKIDADTSGDISKEELSSALSKRADRVKADELFTAFDTDTSGSISQTELQDALKKYFYSKVGVTYEPPAPITPPATEEPGTTTPPTDTTGEVTGSEPASEVESFTAVA